MAQVLLINPRRRKRRKMSALQRKFFGKRRSRRVRRNPISSNPRRRRRRASARVRRFRRNPIRARGMMGQVMPTLAGAGGALLTDAVIGFLPLPAMLATPTMRPLVRAGAALGLGWGVGQVTNRSTGRLVMAGALTVVAYDFFKGFLQSSFPTLPLGALFREHSFPSLGYAGNDAPLIDENSINASGVGALFDPGDDGMGALVDEDSIF